MSATPSSPTTTARRLTSPLNGTVYTTTRTASPEKPLVSVGDTMAAELGSTWADSIVVAVEELPAEGQGRKVLQIVHARIPSFSAQDASNFQMNGDELSRTYIIPRGKYHQLPTGSSAAGVGEFTYPPGGTPDSVFAGFVFTDDRLRRIDPPLDEPLIAIDRIFSRPVTSDVVRDDNLHANVRVTKTVVPKGYAPADGSNAPGKRTEVRDGNFYHDILVEQQVVFNMSDATPPAEITEWTLPTINEPLDYRFPPKLDSVTLDGVKTYAKIEGDTFDEAFACDMIFAYGISLPKSGPFPGRRIRTVTTYPDVVVARYEVFSIPVPQVESISAVYAWSATMGSAKASATAREWNVPDTIHAGITIASAENILKPVTGDRWFYKQTLTLGATPGYTEFLAKVNPTVGNDGWITVDVKNQEVSVGMYEVTAIQINIQGLYS